MVLMFLLCNPCLVTRKCTLKSTKISKDVKLCQLSDFHSGACRRLLGIIEKEGCDYIVITGDFFDERRSLKRSTDLLKQLNKIAPIYFVSGNHEYKNKKEGYQKLRELLLENDVEVLDNRKLMISKEICFIGIEDCRQFPTGSEWKQEKEVIDSLLQDLDEDTFNLVLIHRPDHAVQFDEYPIDLMLSGHAHGGQWRIPGILNGVYAPQQGLFPKRAGGVYSLPHGIQVVSRGLAWFWWLPRLMNRPEVNFIEIKKEEGSSS